MGSAPAQQPPHGGAGVVEGTALVGRSGCLGEEPELLGPLSQASQVIIGGVAAGDEGQALGLGRWVVGAHHQLVGLQLAQAGQQGDRERGSRVRRTEQGVSATRLVPDVPPPPDVPLVLDPMLSNGRGDAMP